MWRLATSITLLAFAVKSELYSSTAHIKGMLLAEEETATILEEYVAIERQRLNQLEKLTEAYTKRNKEYLASETYLNPVDVFVMFREKIRDWDEIRAVMQNDSGTRFVRAIQEVREDAFWYPTEEEDLFEAATSLLRIQETYEISPEDVVNGRLKHIRANNKLSADDILYVGQCALEENNSYHALQWLQLAQNRLQTMEAYAHLLKTSPKETLKESKYLANHYCYYKQDRPELLLAPVKVEIVYLDPLVVVFRDVIRDKEIVAVKKYSTPDMVKAGVYDAQTKTAAKVGRISKKRQLDVSLNKHLTSLSKRIDLLTNLETGGEKIVGINYGVGGHFDPHFDFQSEGAPRKEEDFGKGNRIATIIFYLTQPDYGGSTIFTELDLAVKPTKNDAIFWYNLYRNGDEDRWTRHASCPILSGEKWIAVQFIHEMQQAHRRPCGLEKNDWDHFVGDIGQKPSPRYATNF